MAQTGNSIEQAASFLMGGSLVAIPTETVYGLAANALNEAAVAQIFAVKNRPVTNPLILHIASKGEVGKYVKEVPAIAEKLMERFWPGPLTLLLPKSEVVPDIITASLPTVAVRVPDHSLTLQLLQSLPFPLAAPSANPFGYISPTRPEHVSRQIGGKIAYILDGGACLQGVESTIVGFEDDLPVVYRLGAISFEEIQAVTGALKLHRKEVKRVVAPGMLPYHYSPRTPLYLVNNVEAFLKEAEAGTTGVITFCRQVEEVSKEHMIVLSAAADLREAARKLYGALHQLDEMGLKRIIAERLPDKGLGQTLNDRLERAAARYKEEKSISN